MNNKLKVFIVILTLLLALFSIFVLFWDKGQNVMQTQSSEELTFRFENDGADNLEVKAGSPESCGSPVVDERMKRYGVHGTAGYFENMNLSPIVYGEPLKVPYFDSVRKDSAVRFYEPDILRIEKKNKAVGDALGSNGMTNEFRTLYHEYNFFYRGRQAGSLYYSICYHYEDCSPNLYLYVLNGKLETVSGKMLAVGNGCFVESEESEMLDDCEIWQIDAENYVTFLSDSTFVISECKHYSAVDVLTEKKGSLEECENIEYFINSEGKMSEIGRDTVRTWSKNLGRQ